MDLLLKPAPHTEAAKWIADKPVLAREAFDNLLPDLKGRAFTITGVEAANVMQNVRDRIAELPQGADWDAVKGDIAAQISPWLDTMVEPGSGRPDDPPSVRRAELLLRVHGYQAYTVAAEDVANRQRAAFPFAQYLSSRDERVRASHEALDGIVLPADSPFWDRHTPPWEWGCRCQKVYLTRDDVGDIAKADARKIPEARRVVSGDRLRRLETSNQIAVAGPGGMPRFINVEPSRTFTFDRTTLRMKADDLRQRYSPETWRTFERWARSQPLDGGQTVWSWLGGARPAAGPQVLPPPAPAPVRPKIAPRPPPAPPAPKPAPVPPPTATSSLAKKPVGSALEVKVAGPQKREIETTISAIGRIHDDGALPLIPIIGRTGGRSLGVYQFTRGGAAMQIGVRNAADHWPGMSAAHEIGHFLDHQALGRPGQFASASAPALQGFRDAVAKSASLAEIQKLPAYRQQYFIEPHELWARAYAQYVAIRSRDPMLLAQLQKIRSGSQPWRQWSDEDFAPIASAIDDIFREKGWLKS